MHLEPPAFPRLWRSGRVPRAHWRRAAPGGTYSPSYEFVAYETPRALAAEEIPGIVEQFRNAAANAIKAGFDGVEIHGANGYLIDEFLQNATNSRTDNYGGSSENRSRFLFEVLDAVIPETGANRLGVRLSPWSTYNGMSDTDPLGLFTYVVKRLNTLGLAYLHMPEGRADGVGFGDELKTGYISSAQTFSSLFDGPFISAGGYSIDSAKAAVSAGKTDAIAFGRLFIANPDLPERIAAAAALNAYDRSKFYGGGAEGYADYPMLGYAS